MCGLLALSESTVPVVQGLKTGMYYLRTKAAANAIQFTIDKQKLAKANQMVNEMGDDGLQDHHHGYSQVIAPPTEAMLLFPSSRSHVVMPGNILSVQHASVKSFHPADRPFTPCGRVVIRVANCLRSFLELYLQHCGSYYLPASTQSCLCPG